MTPLGSVQRGAVEAALASKSHRAVPFATNSGHTFKQPDEYDIDIKEMATNSDTARLVRC
jgi:hypothetical protein